MTSIKDPKKYKVIGTRPVRPDGTDKVTGRALYGADFDITGLLHGKILRSPHPHARIKSINFDEALKINPKYSNSIFFKAITQLKIGDYANGWKNYEHRW